MAKGFFIFMVVYLFRVSLVEQQVRIVHVDEIQLLINNQSDTTYIINFFASWCKPCLKEIPEFNHFADANKDAKLKVVFVSLDVKKNYELVLLPLLKKYNIRQTVYLLDEPDADKWINQIDSNWSGSIPATLIVNNIKHSKKFIAEPLTYDELNKLTK